jgi:hypothetical protein
VISSGSKNLKYNLVLKISKRGTIFSIETPSDLEGMLNEKSGKSLGLEFDRI